MFPGAGRRTPWFHQFLVLTVNPAPHPFTPAISNCVPGKCLFENACPRIFCV